jgi:hypothetical protein
MAAYEAESLANFEHLLNHTRLSVARLYPFGQDLGFYRFLALGHQRGAPSFLREVAGRRCCATLPAYLLYHPSLLQCESITGFKPHRLVL